jgi:AraC family transcriptional regulator
MRPQTEQTYQERILRVLVHIQTHLSDDLPLEELAAVARFSPYHFHRLFRAMVGESVKEHVRRLRLERAAHRLKHGDQPITWVALEAGYETHEAFTRAFSARFGVPPSQFREAWRLPPGRNGRSAIHYDPEGRLDDFQGLQAGGPPADVRVESVPILRVAFMRHTGAYDDVRRTWDRLLAWAGPRGLLGKGATLLAVPHDDPDVTPPGKVRYDACILVDERFRPEGEVGVQQLGGGEHAVTTHRGPYEDVGETFDRLCGEWLPTSGRELRSAPPLLVYRNTPQDAAPGDLLTEVYMPLTPEE